MFRLLPTLQVRIETEELAREKERAEANRAQAEKDKEVLLSEAQAALYADSLVMGSFMRENRTALARAWQVGPPLGTKSCQVLLELAVNSMQESGTALARARVAGGVLKWVLFYARSD
jgi:hypothetical protein